VYLIWYSKPFARSAASWLIQAFVSDLSDSHF